MHHSGYQHHLGYKNQCMCARAYARIHAFGSMCALPVHACTHLCISTYTHMLLHWFILAALSSLQHLSPYLLNGLWLSSLFLLSASTAPGENKFMVIYSGNKSRILSSMPLPFVPTPSPVIVSCLLGTIVPFY